MRASYWAVAGVLALSGMLGAQERERRTRLDVENYVLTAEINPNTQMLNAKAEIRFVPLEERVRVATFELHGALNVSAVTDASGRQLTFSRDRSTFTFQIEFPEALPARQPVTVVVNYGGRLTGKEDSPVYGIRFAAIQPEYAYFLYPSRWFPLNGYTADRYTMELRIVAPAELTVVSGGDQTSTSGAGGRQVRVVKFAQPTLAGSFALVSTPALAVESEGIKTRVYFRDGKAAAANAHGVETGKLVSFFTSKFGLPPSANLALVETEEGAPAGYAALGVIFLAPNAIREEPNIRLLANQVSRQWWGATVSASPRDHIWLVNGLARYAEALYLEHLSGTSALEAEMRDIYVDALTIDNIPVIQAPRYEDYSPEFWALSASKGAAVLHMLRGVLGEEKFWQLLKEFSDRYAWKAVATVDFRRTAEELHGQGLEYFFIQWIESTGAPEFDAEYTVFRTRKGFRIIGKIKQDLDTFRMPMTLKIETEGNPETAQVEVFGTSSEFVVETFGKPKNVILDPDNKILRLSDPMRVAVAIRRGEQFAEIGDYANALKEYQRALEVNRYNSLAHYRIAEIFFLQNNFQSAANQFREALNGDLDPPWTEVWSRINLGKIFDITGQRERAVNEYQQAIRTKDNTQGAQEEAAKYLKQPYERENSRV